MSDALIRMRIALADEGVDDKRARSLLFWARAFLNFNRNEKPADLSRADVEAFLDDLAHNRFAGRPTRLRALEAVERLYMAEGNVPAWLRMLLEEQRSGALPNVLSRDEVRRLMARLLGPDWLATALIYGTGIRLLECVRLRVRDIDLKKNVLIVRDAGDRELRRLSLPDNIHLRLREHMESLKLEHIRDIVENGGEASLPPAIAARQPQAARQWGWQYLFPERRPSGRGKRRVIHHIEPRALHARLERAAMDAGIYRRVTGHVLRNSFALHMIERGVPVREVERLLGTRRDKPDESATALPGLALPDGMRSERVTIN